jgi:hypothetical protein
MDVKEEQPENAQFSIRDNLQPDSNVNEESAVQPRKQYCERISTPAGIQIDFKDEQP